MMWPQNILMVTAEHFDIKYRINPYMVDSHGQLQIIDKTKALQQWTHLKNTFESLGVRVHLIPGQPDLPDMVFCANQMFPFYQNKKLNVILSNMNSPFRQNEVSHFKKWAEQNETIVHTLPPPMRSFEGMGDLLWNYETQKVYGGFGYRTAESVYDDIERIIDRPIHRLELTNEHFYHLDTCLCLLNKDSALYVEEAFTPTGLSLLNSHFKNLIRIPIEEARNHFAANACCLHGTDVVIQQGSPVTESSLKQFGFRVHTVDTSEFIKSGGSVFCLKLLF